MENASKALLMAGGILVGILILTLIVTLFLSAKDLSKEYETTKQTQAIQQFNVNFIKYIGQDLTIHQVVTITNFANKNNVEVINGKTSADIGNIVATYEKEKDIPKYRMTISYSEDGYVNKVEFK